MAVILPTVCLLWFRNHAFKKNCKQSINDHDTDKEQIDYQGRTPLESAERNDHLQGTVAKTDLPSKHGHKE